MPTDTDDTQTPNDTATLKAAANDKLSKKDGLEKDSSKKESGKKAAPKNKSKLGLLLPAALLSALGGGAVGGFIVHKFLDAPVAAPDFSHIEARIEGLQNSLSQQDSQNQAFDQRLNAQSKKLSSDLASLEEKWAEDVAQLEASIAARESEQFAPKTSLPKAPIIKTDVSKPSSDKASDIQPSGVQSSGVQPSGAPLADEKLAASVRQLRTGVNKDIKAIKARLKKLEAQKNLDTQNTLKTQRGKRGAPAAAQSSLSAAPVFPKADIMAALGADAPSDAPQNWWDKLVTRHVSVKRTDRVKAEATLNDMEAAISAGDWAAVERHAQNLPEPARIAAEEWIAATRP